MAISDVSIPQDGGQGNVKLHPYLITLVRWCVSCLWSTATVFLHRLVTTPLPPITASASKQPPRPAPRSRRAGKDHLHPEPRVECVVLHTPEEPTLDVIFVHGLYGSLGNTWRQGEWRTKYKLDPTKVPLRNHSTEPCNCTQNKADQMIYNNFQQLYAYETNLNETNLNEKNSFNQFNGCFKKILPNESSLITEKFYNNTLISVDVDHYETQAKFVTELFKNDCDKNCDFNTFKCNFDRNGLKCNCEVDVNERECHSANCKCNLNEKCKINECQCKLNVKGLDTKCEMGCGCICDDCYSSCWPRDWIKEDFPGARVISINYTSDPYLWRPLWVKGNKRLRLHERAEQMMEQLLQLGVGQRPIIWVGHSKGGLFIKQIYCEAYEAYLKTNKNELNDQNTVNNNRGDQSDKEYNNNHVDCNVESKHNRYKENKDVAPTNIQDNDEKTNINTFIHKHFANVSCTQSHMTYIRNNNVNITNDIPTENLNNIQEIDNTLNIRNNSEELIEKHNFTKKDDVYNNTQARYDDTAEYIDISVRKYEQRRDEDMMAGDSQVKCEDMSSNDEEELQYWRRRGWLWRRSAGFLFYSVPHRGSPLADIKTPITCRSVELLEIAKDCPLVLQLQQRWLVASQSSRPVVRSLVETCKTLMSVLWLRIVSVDSADAGVGSLHGVSVDHREICKPSSRQCLLYTELTDLIRGALRKCDCQ